MYHRKLPARSRGGRVSYKESGSEESELETGDTFEPENRPSTRSQSKRVAYAEPSSEDDDDDDDIASTNAPDELALPTPPPRKRQRRTPQQSKPNKPRQPAKSSRSHPARNLQTSRKQDRRRARPQLPKEQPIPTDGVRPDLSALPYEILFNIFQYASCSVHNDASRPRSTRSWLIRTAGMCKAFAEPALAALYRDPPLAALNEPHMLVDLLSRDQSKTTINYSTKIKCLRLGALQTLAYTSPGRGLFEISSLIDRTPLLTELYITNELDSPPYRLVGRNSKWSYPESLFDSLERNDLHLKGWRWNGSFQNPLSPTELVEEVHMKPCMQRLKHLEVSHVDLKSQSNSPKKPAKEPVDLLKAIAPLKELESLSLETCEHEEWDILLGLTKTLKHLKIINTPWLSSSVVTEYLKQNGHELLSLDLSHNQYLDLSFLTVLRDSCPKLQAFRMDTRYYNTVTLTKDSHPLYDHLLIPDDTPTWPRSLISIEMLQLRKWEVEGADAFFTSLVDSSKDLPLLRRLIIKASLSMGWRDRAKFRDKYINGMRHIFKRKADPPSPELASMRAYREWKAAGSASTESRPDVVSPAESSVLPPLRRATRARATYNEDTDTDNESNLDGIDDFVDAHIQGLCGLVDVNVDNIRPGEVFFRETDFIDTDRSDDDEDWNAENDAPSTPHYAW